MKKLLLILLSALLLCVLAPPVFGMAEGSMDFSQLPFLSEAAVDDDPAGSAPILFMATLGTTDTEIVPDFPIRIVDAWTILHTNGNDGDVFLLDGDGGEAVTSTWSSTAERRVTWIARPFEVIDPATESLYIDVGASETSLVGRLYILAVRVL